MSIQREQRAAHGRLRKHIHNLVNARDLGHLGCALGLLRAECEVIGKMHNIGVADMMALAASGKVRQAAAWRQPVVRAMATGLAKIILRFAAKHADFTVDDLLDQRSMRNMSRHTLVAELHNLATVGARPLKKQEDGIRGPKGKPARYALR